MTAATTPTQALCRQCAAPLPVQQGTQFVNCQFCGTANFVDKARAVFHYAVRQTVRDNDALAALRRWMGGNDTVKNLDAKAKIESSAFEMFPMWLLRAQGENGEERVLMEPAAAISISELKQLVVPAASLEPYDHSLGGTAVAPTVPYDMMLEWLQNDHGLKPEQLREASLVHLPIYIFKYSYEGKRYTAVVDAATSKVFANIFPAKWELPFVALGGLAFAVYFLLAWAPLGGFFAGDVDGLFAGLGLYCLTAPICAIPIFLAALFISART
jgi:hypothetical protein